MVVQEVNSDVLFGLGQWSRDQGNQSMAFPRDFKFIVTVGSLNLDWQLVFFFKSFKRCKCQFCQLAKWLNSKYTSTLQSANVHFL